MNTDKKRTPYWILERIALGEWNEEYHLSEEDLVCLNNIKKSNDAFFEKYPVPPGKPIKMSFMDSLKTVFRSYRIPSIAVATLLLIVFIPMFLSKEINENRVKGASPHIFIYKKNLDNTVVKLQDQAIAQEGDVLQLGYFAVNYKNGILLSIDGNKNITVHFPEEPGKQLVLNKETILPTAIKLDDSPEYEKFYLILSNDDLPLGLMEDYVKDPAKKIDDKYKVVTFTINKRKLGK
jgi:hypothetical protein